MYTNNMHMHKKNWGKIHVWLHVPVLQSERMTSQLALPMGTLASVLFL